MIVGDKYSLNLSAIGDLRGKLIALEENREVPFSVKRVYFIYNNVENEGRGFHAHRTLSQVAICISGRCEMLLDDGETSETMVMSNPEHGVLIPPMVWHEMHNFSSDCVLLVLASDFYDESDYIRSRNEFDDILCRQS